MTSQIVVDAGEFLGVIRINGKLRFFYNILSMWILDYSSYEPEYSPDKGGWREGLLFVDKDNAELYCQYMVDREVSQDAIPNTVSIYGGQLRLTFLVDFDNQLFVSGFQDNILVHEYVPNGWTSIEGNPYDYLPPALKTLWTNKQ